MALAIVTVTTQEPPERCPVVSGGGSAINVGRRHFLKRRLKVAISQQPEIKTLRALLLQMGGAELVAPPWHDCQVPALVRAGFAMDGHVALKIMRPCACHRNVSRLWARKRSGLIGIGTGYALSSDGLWRQHSWGVGRLGIVETTEARAKYFGQLFRGADAGLFAACNR